ncbi:MAG: sulfotransferase [Bacteroidales bacterium]|nr:sulfotransferase [Bacteroidales bacterium]
MGEDQKKKQVFFHVGLPKTASTYLQHYIFPKLKGITYFKKKHFKDHHQLITNTENDKFLFSSESDHGLEKKLEKIAARYPDAGIIIVFRRHDSWISSKYKYHIRKHGGLYFREFFDIYNDQGLWHQSDLLYQNKLNTIRKLFRYPPLVLNYHDLKANQDRFLDQLLNYLGADLDREAIRDTTVKKAFNERQLVMVRKLNRKNPFHKPNTDKKLVKTTHRKYRELILHSVAQGARLLPDQLIPDEKTIPKEDLKHIRKGYQEDWEYCENFFGKKLDDRK